LTGPSRVNTKATIKWPQNTIPWQISDFGLSLITSPISESLIITNDKPIPYVLPNPAHRNNGVILRMLLRKVPKQGL